MTPKRKSEEPSESPNSEPEREAPEQRREREYPPLSEKKKKQVLNEVERSCQAGALDLDSVKRTRSEEEDM